MNLANFFTLTRILAAPLFVCIYFLPLYTRIDAKITIAIIIPLFIFMEFTDFLDGFFARKYKQVSDFGKLFDPFADVVANITILLAFMLTGYVPLVFFLIILYREMGILFLRMIARGEGITIAAKKGGKAKTVCYIAAEGFSLFIEMTRLFFTTDAYFIRQLHTANTVLYGAAVLLSLVSFFDYLISYRKNHLKRSFI
ncbi:MAG: CDP-diacylglycerol--glycerol-3-phosphate 3-phosphatidyltransferase [Treponema sp.]